jgi:DNA-binding NtrC family response regulator
MSAELKIRLLVVDDEQSIRKLCMTIGTSLNFACVEAESAEAAVSLLDAEVPDIVLTDLKLPSQSGVDLLRQVKTQLPRTEVAIMTGHGSIESAVDAMKIGAYDYIEDAPSAPANGRKNPPGHRKRIPSRARQHRRKP